MKPERAGRYRDKLDLMCKDLGSTPQDDYGNLDRLEVLKEPSREILKEANGLRNHLIHRYNRRDDQLARQSMADLLPGIFAFTKEVAAWLERILSLK